jgi:hypothetical protein
VMSRCASNLEILCLPTLPQPKPEKFLIRPTD